MGTKKTTDPVDSLLPTSRKALEAAPPDGRYVIPYPVGHAFFIRGWGSHLGKCTTDKSTSMPMSLFQLNEEGLKAARSARNRSRSELHRITYEAVHEATLSEVGALLEDFSLDGLIRDAEATITRVEEAGYSTAGACGYRDALIEYRDQQTTVTA